MVGLLTRPVGVYLDRVFSGQRTWLDPVLRPCERGLLRLAGVRPDDDMPWGTYARAFVAFGLVGALLLYAVLRLQYLLPGTGTARLTTPMTADLAANTAVSFATTATWQAYSGENTLGPWAQLLGLVAQNFLAGAAGLAVGIAFIRGLAREGASGLGNFWIDTLRAVLWVLLPASLVLGLAFVAEGVPADLTPVVDATTLEGAPQTIALGPVAPLVAIKNLGTNGGGYFGANGAHPLENPTPLSNLLAMLAIVVLPAGLTHTFGRMTKRTGQGWLLLGLMMVLFAGGLWVADFAEQVGNPQAGALAGVEARPTGGHPGGNLEGKETRFGIGSTVLAVVATSNGATGSYSAMHDSLMPLGGLVPLANMLLGEIAFGGLGTGLIAMVMAALLGVFMAGLMIGRTPAYLGKNIGIAEMKLIVLYAIAAPVTIGVLTAVALAAPAGRAALQVNDGPHGFTEVLFAFASCVANNGQTFAGLSANSPFYNVATALAMMAGRYALAIPALALAGSFARQSRRPNAAGTLPTESLLFAVVVVGSVLIVGGLSFFPALVLGPVLEWLRIAS